MISSSVKGKEKERFLSSVSGCVLGQDKEGETKPTGTSSDHPFIHPFSHRGVKHSLTEPFHPSIHPLEDSLDRAE